MMYPFLKHKSIVLANHTVQALTKIGEYNHVKAEEILDELIENSSFFKNTTVGFIIEALSRFKEYDELDPRIKKFVEPYLASEMKVVAQKAKRTLETLG